MPALGLKLALGWMPVTIGGVVDPLSGYVIDGDAPTLVMDGGEAVYGLNEVIEPRATVIPLTRASTATYVGSDGLLTSASVDGLRMGHDPVTLAVLGVLIEAAATNLEASSNDFSGWTDNQGSIIAAQAIGWDGEVSMSELLADSAGASGFVHATSGSYTVATTTAYVWSVVVKAGALDWCHIEVRSFTTPVTSIAYFDLANGVVGTKAAGIDTSGIIDLGGGLYRIYVVFTTDVSDIFGQIRFGLADTDNDRTVARDGVSSTFLSDVQFELGTYPSSLIPTTGGTGNRSKDIPEILTSAFGFSDTSGTVLCEFSAALNGGQRLFTISDGTANNAIYVDRTAGGDITLNVIVGGVSQASVIGANNVTDDVIKVAVSWEVNDFAITVNGVTVVTDAAGTIPTGLTNFSYGMDGLESNQLYGEDKKTIYYPTRLSDDSIEIWASLSFIEQGYVTEGYVV